MIDISILATWGVGILAGIYGIYNIGRWVGKTNETIEILSSHIVQMKKEVAEMNIHLSNHIAHYDKMLKDLIDKVNKK